MQIMKSGIKRCAKGVPKLQTSGPPWLTTKRNYSSSNSTSDTSRDEHDVQVEQPSSTATASKSAPCSSMTSNIRPDPLCLCGYQQSKRNWHPHSTRSAPTQGTTIFPSTHQPVAPEKQQILIATPDAKRCYKHRLQIQSWLSKAYFCNQQWKNH